jgi:ADP-heptose:LPS heptosyltransferase
VKLLKPSKVIISRTDGIGDVILTYPICKWLKTHFPETEIIYLGRNYTQSVIEAFSLVDCFISWDDIVKLPSAEQIIFFRSLKADTIIHVFPHKEVAKLAKKVKIENRIGTSHRLFHLLTCNIRVDFTRKKSNLHESQLNFELFRPFGLQEIPSWEEINSNLETWRIEEQVLPNEIQTFLNSNSQFVILHPKSQGSAKEWPIVKYIDLAEKLTKVGYSVIFTGTENEGKLFRSIIPSNSLILDTTGKLTLKHLIFLISNCMALVACSTGPLHIAGISGVKSIGLFSSKRPIHPGRWRPLGRQSKAIVYDSNCPICAKKKECACIEKISVETILAEIKKGA